jgi:hypothetical protein
VELAHGGRLAGLGEDALELANLGLLLANHRGVGRSAHEPMREWGKTPESITPSKIFFDASTCNQSSKFS